MSRNSVCTRFLIAIIFVIHFVTLTSTGRGLHQSACHRLCGSGRPKEKVPYMHVSKRQLNQLQGRMGGDGFGAGGGASFGGTLGFSVSGGFKAHLGWKETTDNFHEYSRGTDQYNYDVGNESKSTSNVGSFNPYGSGKVYAKVSLGYGT